MFAVLMTASLAACGGADASAEKDADSGTNVQADASAGDNTQAASGETGEAVLSYEETTYSAELAHCLVGVEDALFHGPVVDDAGAEVGYIGGDFGNLTDVPYGEVRVDFGATQQFDSSDSFVAIGDSGGDIVVTEASESSLGIVGGVWDENGTHIATGTLTVSC